MAVLENKKNFFLAEVKGKHGSGDTTINIKSSDISVFPDPASVGNYDVVWWDATNYGNPTLDPNVEIVTVTGKDSNNETITVTRGVQGTTATDKNTNNAQYKMAQAFWAKDRDNIETEFGNKVDGPGSSTDNAIPRYDGSGGKTIQDSDVLLNDSNEITQLRRLEGYFDSGNATPEFRPDYTLGGSEPGWFLPRMRLTQGRFDYDEQGGKCEIRLHGGGGNNFPTLNFLEIDSFANYLSIKGGSSQDAEFYAGVQVKFSSRTATGNIRYGNAGGFEGYDGSEWRALSRTPQSETVTVASPTNSENRTIFFATRALTISEVAEVVVGSSSPSVDYNVKHASNRDAGSPNLLFGSDRTVNTTSGNTVSSFNDATIPADSWVWFETSATSGTVDEVHISLRYRED